MARAPKPTHVLELPLDTTPGDDRRLEAMFVAGQRLNNVLIQDGRAIVAAIRSDPAWQAARQLPRATKEQRVARAEAFKAVRIAHGFTEYNFQTKATAHKNAAGFADRIGSHIAQKLGTKVFRALDEWLYGKRGMPRFKGVKRPLHSLEGKNNKAMFRWDREAMFLVIDSGWGIPVRNLRLDKDEWLWSALLGEVKYCRIVRRNVKGKVRYYAQLAMAGHAQMKASVAARLADKGTTGGLDIGPSNIAWCTETDAGVFKFCAEVDEPKRLVKRLARQVDRQRRANNPGNFDEKGRAKRGRKWVKSERQKGVEARLRATQTHTAECRANAHGRDINQLLGMARTWRHDGVSVRSLQKNYGRSVTARAPGHFMSELERKAERAGGKSREVNVRQLKTSQYDHSTGQYVKKALSQRWHTFGDGRGRVQRDVYSAFLALHAVEKVDAEGVITWSHDPVRLQAAWVRLEPALRAKGLLQEEGGVDTSTRARIARCASSSQPKTVKRGSSESLRAARPVERFA